MNIPRLLHKSSKRVFIFMAFISIITRFKLIVSQFIWNQPISPCKNNSWKCKVTIFQSRLSLWWKIYIYSYIKSLYMIYNIIKTDIYHVIFFLNLLSVWWHCICGTLSVDYKELNILAQRLKKLCYYRDTHILLLFNNAMILYRLINGKRWKSSFHKYCWYRTTSVTV